MQYLIEIPFQIETQTQKIKKKSLKQTYFAFF